MPNPERKFDSAPRRIVFAAEALSEHAENVVQKARADVEAFVVRKAEQLGIDPGEISEGPLLIGPGDDAGE